MQPVRICIFVSAIAVLAATVQTYAQNENIWTEEQQTPSTSASSDDSQATNAMPTAAPAPAPQPAPTSAVSSGTAAAGSSTNTSDIKYGIGIQTGVRFHDPKVFNGFTTDLCNAFLYDIVPVPVEDKHIFPGAILSLYGTIDFGRYFQIAPFAQGMWAGNQFFFTGEIDKELHVNTYTAMAGSNFWYRFLDRELFTLRVGAGAYGAHTIASISGDVNKDDKVSGHGYGFRGLLGTEFRLNDSFVLTFDCAVPWGVSNIKNKGSIKVDDQSIPYPKKFEHFGFELFPGVMYYF